MAWGASARDFSASVGPASNLEGPVRFEPGRQRSPNLERDRLRRLLCQRAEAHAIRQRLSSIWHPSEAGS